MAVHPDNPAVLTPVRVLSTQYFLYFGVLGVFLPYFNLYLHRIGFSGGQIGAVSGLRSAAVVFMPILWALTADRAKNRRGLFIFSNVAAAGLFAGYFLTQSFWPMLAITAAHAMFYAPIISFMEAFSMEILGKKKERYGKVRAWGSGAFIATVLVVGKLVSAFGARIILWLIFAGSALQAAFSSRFPDIATDARLAPSLSGSTLRQFTRPRVMVFLVAAFLMLVSHGAYYGFYSIYLEGLGYSGTFIGAMWALATAAEVAVMVKSEALLTRLSARVILGGSLLVAAARWAALSQAESPAALVPIQLLHAVTYGSFHVASIVYVERLIPPAARTLGQAANNAMTYGLGLAVGFAINGLTWEAWGAEASFALSALMALAGAALFIGQAAREKTRAKP
ncbi:MAG: MFS transporter [Deltaproteobacteria bacterium]|nr:MFS transporter [Deltaproteobacteria bacterium]